MDRQKFEQSCAIKFCVKLGEFATVTILKGITLDNIQNNVTDELKGIPAEAFQHCYEQWKQRLRRCLASQGNYFEGDKLDL